MTPKVVRGANLKNAKIDSKDAFILSLLDGKLDLAGLEDVAGLPREELSRILERLEGLGLVKLG
jgi:CRP-like cAMP-binding protein